MSTLCRISVVGLYLLLLTHITHSFVLLTANVEDVKKIARRFVSDSLAERITMFLAKATETFVKDSEDSKAEDSSQVSAENKLYNVEKTINDRLDNVRKTKTETKVTPKSLNIEKERYTNVEHKKSKRSKNRKATSKLLHGRSRYIEPVKRAKSSENNDKNIEKQDNPSDSSAPEDKQINNYKSKKRFKLLSAFDSNTTTTAATTSTSAVAEKVKINKSPEKKSNNKPSETPKRSMGAEIGPGKESDYYDTDKEYETDKARNAYDQNGVAKIKNSERNVDHHKTGKNKNTEKAANNYIQYDVLRNKDTETEGASAHMSEKDVSANEINNIIQKDERVVAKGYVVKEKEMNDDKWWEKELTTRVQYDADVQAEGKSWF